LLNARDVNSKHNYKQLYYRDSLYSNRYMPHYQLC